ncbi:hypothetical protein DH86_00000480, partial [Scytalidium sp. 3C]
IQMSQLKVLVVGASIAGPTTAYWFAKAGAKVTVIERSPQLRTNGQNVDIRTTGVTVMRKMVGMEAAVRARMTQMDGINFVRENGHPYATIKATGNPDQQSLVSEYEIFRGDLAKILFDMTKEIENIKYVFGEQVVSMQSGKDDGPITVEFANGSPTSEYDLVVACDGAFSRTRAIGFGCSVRSYVKPMNFWAAYFALGQDLVQGGKMGQAYSAPGGRFVAVGAGPGPLYMNHAVLMGFSPSDNDTMISFRAAMKEGDAALKQFVAQHYKGAGWKTDEVIEGMMEAEDFYANEAVQVRPPNLYKGRCVLVGDAGYAGSAGAGTTLAMTGAYVLAGEIKRHRENLIPPFFSAFMAPQTAWGIWLRNSIFAFITWTRILEIGQKFYAGSFASTDKYRLPDYEWEE